MDGQPHAVHAYAIDSEGGTNAELGGSPRTLTCEQAAPEGVLRHVIDPDSFAAWKFDFFHDVQPLSDALLAARVIKAPWPARPELIQATGQPEVYLVDGAQRRHVPNPAIAAAWRLDLATRREVPVSALADYPIGPPLRAPWLVRGSGPALYVLDVVPLAPPPPLRVAEPPAPAPEPAQPEPTMSPVFGGCSAPGADLTLFGLLLILRRGRGKSCR